MAEVLMINFIELLLLNHKSLKLQSLSVIIQWRLCYLFVTFVVYLNFFWYLCCTLGWLNHFLVLLTFLRHVVRRIGCSLVLVCPADFISFHGLNFHFFTNLIFRYWWWNLFECTSDHCTLGILNLTFLICWFCILVFMFSLWRTSGLRCFFFWFLFFVFSVWGTCELELCDYWFSFWRCWFSICSFTVSGRNTSRFADFWFSLLYFAVSRGSTSRLGDFWFSLYPGICSSASVSSMWRSFWAFGRRRTFRLGETSGWGGTSMPFSWFSVFSMRRTSGWWNTSWWTFVCFLLLLYIVYQLMQLVFKVVDLLWVILQTMQNFFNQMNITTKLFQFTTVCIFIINDVYCFTKYSIQCSFDYYIFFVCILHATF